MLNTVFNIIGAIAGLATAGAFVFAIKSYLRFRKTEQLRIVESIYKDIRDLERERTQVSQRGDKPEELNDWHSRYFNTLEWLSYLTNRDQVDYKMVSEFFSQLIIDSYGFMQASYKGNPKEFPEFKKLYGKVNTQN